MCFAIEPRTPKRSETHGTYHFGEILGHGLGHRMRCTSLWIVAVPVDAVDIFGTVMKLVVAEFLLEVQRDHEDASQPCRKADQVNSRVCLALEEIPEGSPEIVFDHLSISFTLSLKN